MEEPVNASEAKEPAPKDKCKHCGLPIKEIYPGLPEEGYVHVAPGEAPNHHRCKSERTYAEPATKEGEKERPHQADCICRRCEDWDDAHEPAKVEAGEGLPQLSQDWKGIESILEERESQLKASLLREKELRELLEDIQDEAYDRVDIDDEGRPNWAMRVHDRIKAAVTGEQP
jgi:hypothetical protein